MTRRRSSGWTSGRVKDLETLKESLIEAEIPHLWQGRTLLVAQDAEDIVDDLLDAIEAGDVALLDEDAEAPGRCAARPVRRCRSAGARRHAHGRPQHDAPAGAPAVADRAAVRDVGERVERHRRPRPGGRRTVRGRRRPGAARRPRPTSSVRSVAPTSSRRCCSPNSRSSTHDLPCRPVASRSVISSCPVDPAPGFGGLLLGAVVANHIAGVDAELHGDVHRLIAEIERNERIVQPRLRHRFQVDRHGLSHSRHRMIGDDDDIEFDFGTNGSDLAQVLGAVYAVERLEVASRRIIAPVLLKATRWRGPIGPALIAHLAGAQSATSSALADPRAWALELLGFEADASDTVQARGDEAVPGPHARRASGPRRCRGRREQGDPRPQRGSTDPHDERRARDPAAVPRCRIRFEPLVARHDRAVGRATPAACVPTSRTARRVAGLRTVHRSCWPPIRDELERTRRRRAARDGWPVDGRADVFDDRGRRRRTATAEAPEGAGADLVSAPPAGQARPPPRRASAGDRGADAVHLRHERRVRHARRVRRMDGDDVRSGRRSPTSGSRARATT